jgi:hypothetical protein
MKKKGVIEVQLHWIFVLIAGALILTFFITISAKQKDVSHKELVFDINNDIDLIISGTKSTEGSVTEVGIPNIAIDFGCREYSIEGQKKSLQAKPMFASSQIKGDSLILWVLAWKMPFKVDNFIYATSPNVRFLFSNAPNSVYDIMPSKMNIEKVSRFDNLTDDGSYALKLVLFGKTPMQFSFPGWMSKYKTTAVSVYEDQKKVEFYELKNNKWEKKSAVSYLGRESMIGAFFTDNPEDYACIMDKALGELNAVSRVYAERTKMLDNASICPLYYGQQNVALFEQLGELSSSKYKFSSSTVQVVSILSSAELIANLNRDIELQSCPVIY